MENQNLCCATVRDMAPIYLDGHASHETADAIGAHLDGCSDCRRYYRAAARTGAYRPADTIAPPDDGFAGLAKRLRRRRLILHLAAAVAAVLLAAAGFLAGKWLED